MRNEPTRRDFHRGLAALAGAPLLAPGQAIQATAAEDAIDQQLAAGRALADVANAQYGKHLTEEQLKALTERVVRSQLSALPLKRAPIKNSDEPSYFPDQP